MYDLVPVDSVPFCKAQCASITVHDVIMISTADVTDSNNIHHEYNDIYRYDMIVTSPSHNILNTIAIRHSPLCVHLNGVKLHLHVDLTSFVSVYSDRYMYIIYIT